MICHKLLDTCFFIWVHVTTDSSLVLKIQCHLGEMCWTFYKCSFKSVCEGTINSYKSVCGMANDTVFGLACLKVLNKSWLLRQGCEGRFVGFLFSSLICRICAYIKVVGDSLRCLLPCSVYVCIACVVEGIVVYVVVVCVRCVLWAMWCVRLVCVCMVRTVRGVCCVCGICNVVMAVCMVCGGGCVCVWFDKLRHQPWACL